MSLCLSLHMCSMFKKKKKNVWIVKAKKNLNKQNRKAGWVNVTFLHAFMIHTQISWESCDFLLYKKVRLRINKSICDIKR